MTLTGRYAENRIHPAMPAMKKKTAGEAPAVFTSKPIPDQGLLAGSAGSV